MKADLHTHSTASDGTKTPTELMNWAKASGLELVAVTDHDSVSGLDEAVEEGKRFGLTVIPGIEISAFSNREIHILGYNIRYRDPDFLKEVEGLKDMRKMRNAAIGDKLDELGLHLDMDVTADGVGRLNIAKQMVEQHYVKNVNDAFDRYLGPRGCVYSEVKRKSPLEAVKMIKKFGGVASVAHPKAYLQNKSLDMLLDGLKQFGLDGLEVFYPGHNEHDVKELISFADRYNLFFTGGSDYHGDEDKHFQVVLPPRTLKALGIEA